MTKFRLSPCIHGILTKAFLHSNTADTIWNCGGTIHDFFAEMDKLLTNCRYICLLRIIKTHVSEENWLEWWRNFNGKRAGFIQEALHQSNRAFHAYRWFSLWTLNLTKQKSEAPQSVRSDDIHKHRNDVFRLLTTVSPTSFASVPDEIAQDLLHFIEMFPLDSSEWHDITQSLNLQDSAKNTLHQRYRSFFQLSWWISISI